MTSTESLTTLEQSAITPPIGTSPGGGREVVVPSLHIPVTKTKTPKNFYLIVLSRSLFSGSGLGSHGSCDCGVELLLVISIERER